jgi:hypothetical protein
MGGRQLVIKDAERGKLIRILLHSVGYYPLKETGRSWEIDIDKVSFLGWSLGFCSAVVSCRDRIDHHYRKTSPYQR